MTGGFGVVGNRRRWGRLWGGVASEHEAQNGGEDETDDARHE